MIPCLPMAALSTVSSHLLNVFIGNVVSKLFVSIFYMYFHGAPRL
jgi:hypothetical protein